ncbi:MAG: hypothetical protein KKA54_05835 [Proteobacteria bacterium]|nr:hypothetical protein [Pseudomonadota bacterium]
MTNIGRHCSRSTTSGKDLEDIRRTEESSTGLNRHLGNREVMRHSNPMPAALTTEQDGPYGGGYQKQRQQD